jgi:branched-chain amino acid aminotransferase
VWTPPLASGCLPGVTRALLLDEIRMPGLSAREKTLFPADLERADQVFISSTTRDFLPASFIEGLGVRSEGTVLDQVAKAFAEYRENYVARAAVAAPK